MITVIIVEILLLLSASHNTYWDMEHTADYIIITPAKPSVRRMATELLAAERIGFRSVLTVKDFFLGF